MVRIASNTPSSVSVYQYSKREGRSLYQVISQAEDYPELKNGARLFNVRKTLQQQDSVVFYLLDSFEIANAA